MAHVEVAVNLPAMTLPAPELDSTLPTVATRPGSASGVALDLGDPLRGGGEGVVAETAHGRGACVVGLAGEDELHAGLADDGLDDAEWRAFALEDWALLDVELEVAEGGVDRWTAAGISAGSRPKLRMASATLMPSRSVRARVAASSSPTRRVMPRKGLAKRTPSSSEKPMTSMAKGSGAGEAARSSLDEGDAEDDAEDAVECACVGDGVEVGADEEAGGAGCCGGEERAEVACGVDAGGHAGGVHPAGEERVDLAHGGREEGARGLAGDLGGEGDLAAAGDDLFGAGLGGTVKVVPFGCWCCARLERIPSIVCSRLLGRAYSPRFSWPADLGLRLGWYVSGPLALDGSWRLTNCVSLAAALRITRASMWPAGSSVGTNISLGLSTLKRARSTRRQCLLGMVRSIESAWGTVPARFGPSRRGCPAPTCSCGWRRWRAWPDGGGAGGVEVDWRRCSATRRRRRCK